MARSSDSGGSKRRLVVAAILIVVVIGSALFAFATSQKRSANRHLSALRNIERALEPPPGFTQVARSEQAPSLCLVPMLPCDEYPGIRLTFETAHDTAEEACVALTSAVHNAVQLAPDTPPRAEFEGCLWAPLPGIDSGAYAHAWTDLGRESCTGGIPGGRKIVCATVILAVGAE